MYENKKRPLQAGICKNQRQNYMHKRNGNLFVFLLIIIHYTTDIFKTLGGDNND